MRTCYGGDGSDTTAAVAAYLAATVNPKIFDLYIIGRPEDPYSLFMTSYPGPLAYNLYPEKIFQPAVVKRGSVKSDNTLEVQTLDLTWTPSNKTFTNAVGTTSPLQLAASGYYDNWDVYVLRCYMPTPGDCNTLGATPLFGGRISGTNVDRAKIQWKINCFLDVLDQNVPSNVIEASNTLSGYVGATAPAGYSVVPQMTVFTGSSATVLYGDAIAPYAGHIFNNHVFTRGWVIFLPVNGATLAGYFAAIADNIEFTDGIGGHHNQISVYGGFPWPPTPWSGTSGDQFVISAQLPTTQAADPWPALTAVSLGYQIVDSNGNIQTCIQPGTTAASAPSWGATAGAVTTESTGVQWSFSGVATAQQYYGFPYVPQPAQAF